LSHKVKTSRIGRIIGATLVSTALLVAFGASANAATGVVPKSAVEAISAKVLAQETGQKLPKVVCPSGLKAKIGASIHCTVTPHGSTTKYPATVTVRSLHNGVANSTSRSVKRQVPPTRSSSAMTTHFFFRPPMSLKPRPI
jgi:hypothetical protein